MKRIKLPAWTEQQGVGKIYWLSAEGTTLCKFGFTQQSVAKRISNIQVSCPHWIRFVGAAYGTKEDEKHLHALLGRFRRVGEWFDLRKQPEVGEALMEAFGLRVT